MNEQLPKPGEVWGDPKNPESWRFVVSVSENTIDYHWFPDAQKRTESRRAWCDYLDEFNPVCIIDLVESLSERVAAQAELLAKRAESGNEKGWHQERVR